MQSESDVIRQVSEQIERVNARMGKIKHKVAVMSGKGGVGKTVVTANLALALASQGYDVGAIDVDINGPALPKMLGVQRQQLNIGAEGALPAIGPLNIKVMSMDLILEDDETPVIWDGPEQSRFVWRSAMEMSTIREFLSDIEWGELDILLMDLPPGTHQLSNISQLIPNLAGVIMVTIPSEVSFLIVKKSAAFARELGVPVIGLIENMSGFVCPKCGTETALFNSDREKISDDLGMSLLGKIPFDPRLSICSDGTVPFVIEHTDSPAGRAFIQIADKIKGYLVQ